MSLSRMNIALPFILGLFVAFEMFMGMVFQKTGITFIHLAVSLLFLNATHVIFTFLMAAHLEPVRKILGGWRSPSSWALPILIFLTGFIGGIYSLREPDAAAARTFIFGISMWGVWHLIQQSKGLHILLIGELDGSKHKKLVRYHLELLSLLAFALFGAFLTSKVIEGQFTLRPVALSFAGVYLAVFLNLARLLYSHAETRRSALEFSFRWLLWIFVPLTVTAIFALKAIHGLEYWETSKVMHQSGNRRRSWNRALLFSCALFPPFYLCALSLDRQSVLFGSYIVPEGIQNVCGGALAGIIATHYYLDSRLFRFRKPEVRNSILPLLLNGNGECTPALEVREGRARLLSKFF